VFVPSFWQSNGIKSFRKLSLHVFCVLKTFGLRFGTVGAVAQAYDCQDRICKAVDTHWLGPPDAGIDEERGGYRRSCLAILLRDLSITSRTVCGATTA